MTSVNNRLSRNSLKIWRMLSACDDPEEKSKNSGPDNDFGSISKTFRLVAGESRIPLSSLFSLRPNISTIVTLVGYRVIEKSCLSFSFAVLRSEKLKHFSIQFGIFYITIIRQDTCLVTLITGTSFDLF